MGETKVTRIQIHANGNDREEKDLSPIEGQLDEEKTMEKMSEKEFDLSDGKGREQSVDAVGEPGEWKDKYLRLYAELENTKKRLTKKLEIELHEETSAVLLDLLPVADNLERILNYAKEKGDMELEHGLEITLGAFQDAMAKHGVSQIKARGRPFDPQFHEAIGAVSAPEFEDGTVLKVEQTGYFLDGRVLRPAKVLIAGG
jgi:molecular chaperone GrpE